jgi:hypothetical protein
MQPERDAQQARIRNVCRHMTVFYYAGSEALQLYTKQLLQGVEYIVRGS